MMADGGIIPNADNARLFRDALGRFATGVTVVTIMGPDGPMGFTANSFSSLSLDPALVLWSPAKASQRYPYFARGGAGFDGLDWRLNDEGVPVMSGALARFDCLRHATHEGGDHLIIVGQVLRLALEEGEPLVFAKGKFGGFIA
jgi:flavin reductase (DIM6/NTAB) family NADH-FMN oxidoreductase RutF